MRIATAVLAIFLSSAALAAEMHVVPFGPTSATPIDVHYMSICEPRGGHAVTREGSLIRITALDPACVIVLPIPMLETVQLPELLPPGEYRAEVRLEGDTNIYAQTEFVVRNAGPKPFEIHPFAVPAFGTDLRLRLDGVTCDQADCSDITVRVDGVAVGPLTREGDAIWFTAPMHGVGLAEVTVQKSDFVSPSPAALYFFNDPELSVFEQILFPVLFSVNGALGSQWRSEAVLSNPKPWFVENANTLGPLSPCLSYPCGERLDPGAFEKYGDGFPRGAVLHVPRPEAPDLAFGLRIRDVSRQTEGLGTRIPVVRERDLFHGKQIPLLDVPLDPRYRVRVRVYMLEPVLSPFLGGSVLIRRGDTQTSLPFTLTRANAKEPYYADLDLPAGAAGERANLFVDPPLDAVAWAFATVTNNETQQVTIVAPK